MNGSVADTSHCVSNNEVVESSITLPKSDAEPSAPSMDKKGSIELPSRSVYLSNKERLLLRKQALMMKKRPVLAVGIINFMVFSFFVLFFSPFAKVVYSTYSCYLDSELPLALFL